jgi:hypothetical protein
MGELGSRGTADPTLVPKQLNEDSDLSDWAWFAGSRAAAAQAKDGVEAIDENGRLDFRVSEGEEDFLFFGVRSFGVAARLPGRHWKKMLNSEEHLRSLARLALFFREIRRYGRGLETADAGP